jgi:tetratricopeptide (TPR) repeat protein
VYNLRQGRSQYPASDVRVGDFTGMTGQQDAARDVIAPPEWPLLCGLVPPLTDSFVPRQETGLTSLDSLLRGETVVLVPGGDAANSSLGVLGGTGKTGLAAAIAHTAWDQRAVDLLLWVTPTGRDAVLASYAEALARAGLPDPGEGPEAAASALLSWLAETSRPWLAVFDDLADPDSMDGLWPHGRNGRVLVTVPRADAAKALDARTVEVGPFSAREAMAYLSGRLRADPDQWIGALDLATELGCLPVALSQAASVIATAEIDCRQYRAKVAERKQWLAGSGADGYPAIAAATWSLSAELADQTTPSDLARPALALASMLDPHGIPGAVLTSPAACAYLARSRGTTEVDETQAGAALYNLARVGLVAIDTTSAIRTVRIHPLVQATARQNLAQPEYEQAAAAAADSLLAVWPDEDVPTQFEQALRDCTTSLHAVAGNVLWEPDCHPLLPRAGSSLNDAGLARPAIVYWQGMMEISRRLLGPGHPQTLAAREHLASAFEAAGRLDNAVAMHERALADRERVHGPDHPETLGTRANLARAYREAGRPADAVRLAQRVAAEAEQALGPEDPETLAAQSELARALLTDERFGEAAGILQDILGAQERTLGGLHPDTLATRGNLALAYRGAGQAEKAVALLSKAVEDGEQVLGPAHPETITARAGLASALWAAGHLKAAIPHYRRALDDRERVQGADHPDTITVRTNLAGTYHMAKKFKDAIALYKRALADSERVQGPDHPGTITARGNLASAYHSARKLSYAIPLYERTLADCERVLGSWHPDTLTSRGNLAHAYHTAGRLTEAVDVFERTFADCQQALGPGHPLTQAAHENLEAARRG